MISNPNEIKPQEGGQWDFLSRSEFEVLFGGQAGPGKSWALVIDALGLQFKNTPLQKAAIEIPEYRAVLFRRKTTQFTKLIDEAKRYYTQPPFYAEFIQHRIGDPGPSFNFPSGARIFICHMEQEANKEDHQGQEYQYVGFDELTQFTLTQYLYLFSRCRSTIEHLYPRVRSTTNPTGISLIHFKKRFIRNGNIRLEPKRTYYFSPDYEKEPEENPTGIITTADDPDGLSRVFIPGSLMENRILMQRDPTYVPRIKAMGKKYEAALLRGDWDAFGGDFFDDFHSDLGVEPFEIPDEWKLIGSIDPGWSSPCSFGLMAIDLNNTMYRLFTYYERGKSATEHAESIFEMLKGFRYTKGRMPYLIVSGRDAFARKDRYAVISHDKTFADVFREQGLYLQKANTDRVLGWWAWKEAMRRGKWLFFKGYNDPLNEEIVAAERDEKRVEDKKGGGNDVSVSDHALDEQRYGIMAAYKPPEKEKKKPFEGQIPFGMKPEPVDERVFW